jgi:hypothetical protein
MDYFWNGFEKRANFFSNMKGTGKTIATNIAQKGKGAIQKATRAMGGVGGAAQGPTQNMAGAAKSQIKRVAGQFKDDTLEGFRKHIEDYAKNIGGSTAKHVTGHLENIAKNVADPSEIYKALHELGSAIGVVKRPPTMLERAGGFIKEHPIGTGLGALGVGGAAYAAGKNMGGQPQQQQPYQYYNPYQ